MSLRARSLTSLGALQLFGHALDDVVDQTRADRLAGGLRLTALDHRPNVASPVRQGRPQCSLGGAAGDRRDFDPKAILGDAADSPPGLAVIEEDRLADTDFKGALGSTFVSMSS